MNDLAHTSVAIPLEVTSALVLQDTLPSTMEGVVALTQVSARQNMGLSKMAYYDSSCSLLLIYSCETSVVLLRSPFHPINGSTRVRD